MLGPTSSGEACLAALQTQRASTAQLGLEGKLRSGKRVVVAVTSRAKLFLDRGHPLPSLTCLWPFASGMTSLWNVGVTCFLYTPHRTRAGDHRTPHLPLCPLPC